MKQIYKSLMVSLFISCFSCHSYADLVIQNQPITASDSVSRVLSNTQVTPSDESINRLMQVLHVQEMIDDLISQQQQAAQTVKDIPNQLPKTIEDSIFSRKAQQQMQKVFIKYSQLFGQQIDTTKRRENMIIAYKDTAKKYYTQDEVNALIQFYETPMGQQILRKQSLVSVEFLQTAMPALVGNSTQLQKVMPELQKDIEKIFK